MKHLFYESFLPVILLLATVLVILVAVYFKAAFDANQVTVITIDKTPVVENLQTEDSPDDDEDYDSDAPLSWSYLTDPAYDGAKRLVERGATEEGSRQIKELLASQATSDSLNDLAVLHYVDGDKSKALSYMNRAIKLEPNYAQEYFYRGVIHSSLKRYREAIEDYRAALALNPNHFESTYNMGLALSRTEQLEPALEAFIQATRQAASQRKAKAFYNAGLVAAKLHRNQEAEGHFNQAIRHYPAYLKPRLALASLEPPTEEGFRRALTFYNQAIALQPDYATTYLRLGRLHASRQDYRSAAEAFRKAIQYRPNYPAARYDLGLACFETGDPAEASEQFHWLIERKPRYAPYHLNLGRVAAAVGNPEVALSHYARALELRKGKYADVHFNIGLLEASRNNDPAAQKAFLKAVRQNPQWPEAHYKLGQIYLRQKKYDKAEKAFLEATAQNPRDEQVWFNLGILYSRWDKNDQAIDSYLKALVIRADYPKARLNLAVRYARSGRYSEAISQYRQLLEDDETYALPWYNLGLAYLKTGELDLAREAFKQNLNLEPENLKALKKLSDVLVAQQNFTDAISILEQAVNLDASDPGLRVELADLYRRDGHAARSSEELKKALRLDPDNDKIKQLLTSLPPSPQ